MNVSNPPPQAETAPQVPGWDLRFARWTVRWRWPLTLVVALLVVFALGAGTQRVGSFAAAVEGFGDTSNGSQVSEPLIFDPSLDVWFAANDPSVATYYEIEDRFVAEDYVMVTFSTAGGDPMDDELGVFSPQALATISRLTEEFLTIPGVRHVRSLTSNPWIRWGTIDDGAGGEPGLIISDLVEGDPLALSEDALVERMIAVLGAERTAQRLGVARVERVLGSGVDFADHLGEPRLLGTIVDPAGDTTAIQVQVLRPYLDDQEIAAVFGPGTDFEGDPANGLAAANLYASRFQRAALRGIEHFLGREAGLVVAAPGVAELEGWIAEQPAGEAREGLRLALADPTRAFMQGPDGTPVRTRFEYRPTEDGGFVDRSIPTQPVAAPVGFEPSPRSPYTFHLGGVPLFERNFEETGMADAFYIPLMFLVIAVCLLLIFRHPIGIIAPFAVVVGGILAMVGTAFALGDLFNNLTIMAPNMLTAVGIADAVHLVAAWALLRSRYDDKNQLLTEVVRRNALPVLLTSITTSVGFLSLTVSSLAPVTMLGYTAGLGTLAAYVLSMTVVPALLSLVPHRPKATQKKGRLERFFNPERSTRLVRFAVSRRVPILATTALVVLVAGFGVSQVAIDTDMRGMFPDSNPTMSDFAWIEDRMGGVGDLEIVFATESSSADAAPSLTLEQEERLSELRLRRTAVEQGLEGFAPLGDAELEELRALEAAEQRWNAGRIGISPEFLAELDAFERRLRQEMADPASPLTVVTDLLSPLDVLRKMHQVQNENRAAHYRVPQEGDVPDAARATVIDYDEWSESWSLVPPQDASTLVAQYYLQYENGARPGENLTTELSADRTQLRMQGRVVQASSLEHLAAFERIEQIAVEEFPRLAAGGLQVTGSASAQDIAGLATVGGSETPETALAGFTLSGKTLLFALTTDIFANGFTRSMILALGIITLLIGLIFRSLRLALVSVIPNVLPIAVPLSVFGLFGTPLHGPAILVSSVALGVCVDDTIHFLTKFVRARREGYGLEAALSRTLQETGAAITITTVVLMVGFSTLLLSDFTPNFMMGALATVMIALAWFADLILLPAFLSLLVRDRAPVAETAPAIEEAALAS